jgi:DNA-binding NarL/FixJ family response regulator
VIRTVVADDADDIRVLVGMAVRLDGRFEVVAEADNGEATLAAVNREDPDLLVLDLAMPGMDGLEVLVNLDLRRRRRPATVVLSGFVNEAMVGRALALGAAACVPKGGDLQDLIDVLAAAAERTSPPD